jgi:hypothetical protein
MDHGQFERQHDAAGRAGEFAYAALTGEAGGVNFGDQANDI